MRNNRGEWLATILAYAIPALQFLYALLGSGTQDIFLFREQFVVVSVFTGVVSYALILLVRENPYFHWQPFQRKLKAQWREWNTRTNTFEATFTEKEVRGYKTTNVQPAQVFEITADNITPRILIPLVLAGFVIFIAIGLLIKMKIFNLTNDIWSLALTLLQAFNYTLILVVVVVIFAIFYYRNKNQSQYRDSQQTLFDRALELARDKNSFQEIKAVSLLAHREINQGYMAQWHSFLITVGDDCYILTVDINVEKIVLVNKFATPDDGYNAFFGGARNE